MMEHTPAPWEWDGRRTVRIPHRNGVIAIYVSPEDAPLIVTSPKLLLGCQLALPLLENFAGICERLADACPDAEIEAVCRRDARTAAAAVDHLRALISQAEGAI
jgi:hypothetical protein